MCNSAKQSAVKCKPLPDMIPERISKDKLYNAVIADNMEKRAKNGKEEQTHMVYSL